MARKGENIYKRKDGRWEGRFIIGRTKNGKAKYKSVYGSTYLETKNKLHSSMVSEQNSAELSQNVSEKSELFSDILTDWLSTIQPHVRESSYNKYLNQISKNIIPYLGEKRMSEIDTSSLQQYIATLTSEGNCQRKALSPKTVQDTLSVLRRVFYYAGTNNYKSNCNFQNLYIPSVQCKLTVFSRQEQEQMVSYLMHSTLPSDMGILLTLFTGLRVGEICALTWDKVDLDTGFLRVECAMQRIQNLSEPDLSKTKIVITKPKSLSSIRNIPLPEFIISYLQPFRQSGEEFLLTGSSEKFIEPRALQYRFGRLLEDLNIRKLNFHALRHTFATRCVEAGFDVKSLSEILGHSNVNITLNRYVHPSDEMKLQNMNKLELLFNVKNVVN